MQVGDLVQVNNRCDAGGLWGKLGLVLSLETQDLRIPPRRIALVLMEGRRRIINSLHLDVLNESR